MTLLNVIDLDKNLDSKFYKQIVFEIKKKRKLLNMMVTNFCILIVCCCSSEEQPRHKV